MPQAHGSRDVTDAAVGMDREGLLGRNDQEGLDGGKARSGSHNLEHPTESSL
jgi:hypothetical protein